MQRNREKLSNYLVFKNQGKNPRTQETLVFKSFWIGCGRKQKTNEKQSENHGFRLDFCAEKRTVNSSSVLLRHLSVIQDQALIKIKMKQCAFLRQSARSRILFFVVENAGSGLVLKEWGRGMFLLWSPRLPNSWRSPLTHQREHPLFKRWTFFHSFFFQRHRWPSWTRIRVPNQVPLSQLNPIPHPDLWALPSASLANWMELT